MHTPLQAIWGKYQSGSYIFSTNFWLCCLHIWQQKHMDHSFINNPEYRHLEHLSENSSKNWLQCSTRQEPDGDIWFSGSLNGTWIPHSSQFSNFSSLLEKQQILAPLFKLFTEGLYVGEKIVILLFFFGRRKYKKYPSVRKKSVFCKIIVKTAANYNPVSYQWTESCVWQWGGKSQKVPLDRTWAGRCQGQDRQWPEGKAMLPRLSGCLGRSVQKNEACAGGLGWGVPCEQSCVGDQTSLWPSSTLWGHSLLFGFL